MKILLVPLALVAGEARAHAGSCGDSGSDGGSSDSSSSSSDSSSSGSSDSTPSCVEQSDVLGRRVCSGFGAWALPSLAPILTVESGVSVRTVALGRYGFAGEVDHGTEGSYQYRLVGDEMGAEAQLVSADLRVLGGRRIYAGAEFDLGGVAGDDADMVTMATDGGVRPAEMTPRIQMSFGYGAVLGARVPLGNLRLSAEVFAGGRTLQLAVDSAVGACETTSYAYSSRAAIEPRVRLEAWVSPWLTLGAFAGSDLLSPGPAAGAFLSGHTRAFDGGR